MASDRPTNVQLCEAFRALLTAGATDALAKSLAAQLNGLYNVDTDDMMHLTKPWRADLWKAFAELEERLCPLEVESRRRIKAGTHE